MVVQIDDAGFHVHGWFNPAEEGGLRAAAPMWLTDNVGIAAGGSVRVLDARGAELLITLAPGYRPGAAITATVERWVRCDEVRLDADPDIDALVAVFPPASGELVLGGDATVPLSASPEGPPFAELVPGGRPTAVSVLELTTTHVRVLRRTANGLVAGWMLRDGLVLSEEPEPSRESAGGLVGPSWMAAIIPASCVGELATPLFVTTPSGREEIGSIDPGVRFVQDPAHDADGSIHVNGPDGVVTFPFPADWVVASRPDLACRGPIHPPH